jgi:hypothetical protein
MRVAIPASVEPKVRADSQVTLDWFFEGITTLYPATARDGTALHELDPVPSLDKIIAMSWLVHRWKWGRPMPVYRFGKKGWVRWHLRTHLGDPRQSCETGRPGENTPGLAR